MIELFRGVDDNDKKIIISLQWCGIGGGENGYDLYRLMYSDDGVVFNGIPEVGAIKVEKGNR